jgi:hypothetical protein
MDTYVKSFALNTRCITYILGIGDRHLDNLLLHQVEVSLSLRFLGLIDPDVSPNEGLQMI